MGDSDIMKNRAGMNRYLVKQTLARVISVPVWAKSPPEASIRGRDFIKEARCQWCMGSGLRSRHGVRSEEMPNLNNTVVEKEV